jgi:hypothetical protein
MEVPYDCTINRWTILSDDSATTAGALALDIYRDSYANHPPDGADSIVGGGTKPNIAATNTKGQQTSISGWTSVTLNKGEILRFYVASVTALKSVTMILGVSRV